jgi:hypothetical protein
LIDAGSSDPHMRNPGPRSAASGLRQESGGLIRPAYVPARHAKLKEAVTRDRRNLA